jgi:hypothetical protein
MSLSFRVRRTAGAVIETGHAPISRTDSSGLFHAWQEACASLRAAEQRRDGPETILDLAVEVIRARIALIRDQIADGWQPAPDVLSDLARDELLVREADDRDT